MKIVILAAGKGSRLRKSDLPKPLTPLADGKPILEHQIEALSKYVSLDDVLVVVGFKKNQIIDRFPNLLYLYNPIFDGTNTSKSLLMALNKVKDDVLWLNGDVVFHHAILKQILERPRTSMVVNVGAVGEEEVKYRCGAEGRILEVSKMVKEPQGEALGINFCTAFDLPLLREGLSRCENHDYFEKGIEFAIEQGMKVWCVPIEHNQCVEVDFPEDLDRANTLLVTWLKQK